MFYEDIAKSCDVSLHPVFLQQWEQNNFILALHFIKQYMKRTKINQSENTEQSIQEPDNVSYTDANI